MTAIYEILRRQIEAEGPITIAEYMSTALIHPDHGYYNLKDPFGISGDFITAPEISQMFGELIGLWCGTVWQQIGAPKNFCFAELGPGRGTMMGDALRALQIMPAFLDAAEIHLVEPSSNLRSIQKRTLRNHTIAAWHNGLETLPDGPCIVVGNEFLDTLPIRQIVRKKNMWHERLIDIIDDNLHFTLDHAPSPLERLLPAHASNAVENTLIEISPASLGIAKTIAEQITCFSGAALFIDYGYSNDVPQETLQATQHHHSIDILEKPGEVDLTAHVDFNAFAKAAMPADVHGPLEQGLFLTRLGINIRRNRLKNSSTEAKGREIDSAWRRLTKPEEMGSLFKVIALTQAGTPVPAGFEAQSSIPTHQK